MRVEALCEGKKKGERKSPVEHAVFRANHGIEGDAHAGDWHRQVSILSHEDIESVRQSGLSDLSPGDFAENVILSGLKVESIGLCSEISLGNDVVLTITQIGKVCHKPCRIYHLTGDCIMPRLGLFARVVNGGKVSTGDTAEIISITNPECFQVVVLTISDRCSRGEAVDTAGPAVCALIEKSISAHVYKHEIIPDDQETISARLRHYCNGHTIDMIITVGGTGFSPRDVTPEATKAVVERLTPGLDEAMRASSLLKTPHAVLARGKSGICGSTLILNLPGSKRAAEENLAVVIDALPHGLLKLRGDTTDCVTREENRE